MAYAHDFRDLEVWQRAHALTLAIYSASALFPGAARFGLTAQRRRAVSSIPTNIAEGKSRSGSKPFAAFVDVAAGSAAEVDYLLLLAHDLGYLPPGQLEALQSETVRIRRMLGGLLTRLRNAEEERRRPRK